MFEILLNFFQKYNIDCVSAVPLEACRIKKPYLLERHGITDGSAVIFAVPYYTRACEDDTRNLSSYAVARDYHLFFQSLFDELIPLLKERLPQNKFAGFADHSPIDEIHAAAIAGLGIIGKNGLLITPRYSSYVFLGALITDCPLPCETHPIEYCEHCGACQAVCPAKDNKACLSSLTQKKGILSNGEQAYLRQCGSVWGCDRCQEVCPHTKKAIRDRSIYSPIPYFTEHTLPHLDTTILHAMSEEEFRARAYAWRGRETIERNLQLMEKGEPIC